MSINFSPRRPPPYSGRLRAVLAEPATWSDYWGTSPDGKHLSIWILAGPEAWTVARQWADTQRLFLVAPPGADAARFDWRLCAGHPPLLLRLCGSVTEDELLPLVAALVRDGARRVLRTDTGRRFLAPGEEVCDAA